MPFTASLGEDRKNNSLAACAHAMRGGVWELLSTQAQAATCLTCPFRFEGRPSCSLDFMNVAQTDELREQIRAMIEDIFSFNAGWSHYPSAVHEASMVYWKLGRPLPPPPVVVSDFLGACLSVKQDEDFWKTWNYVLVEGFEGKPVNVGTQEKEDTIAESANKIVSNLVEPTDYWGERLLLLHAFVALLASHYEESGIYPRLLKATRNAIISTCTLKVA